MALPATPTRNGTNGAAPRLPRNQLLKTVGGNDLLLGGFTARIQADFLRELNGSQGYKNYTEMALNSPIIGALLTAIRMAVLRVDWFFSSEAGEDDPRIEFLETARRQLPGGWSQHVSEALDCLVYGFAPFTINYRRDGNGRIIWRKFMLLNQDTIMGWDFNEDGDLVAVRQFPHLWPDPIPVERLLLYRINVRQDNPEGRSILRTGWTSYYYAKNLQQIEAIGYERNLAGLPVLTMPPGADTRDESEDMDRAKTLVRNIRQDEQSGVVLVDGYQLDLLTGGSSIKDTAIDNTIKRYESRMLMGALAQFLLLGQDKVGALSLSTDQTDFFNMSVNALANMLAETFSNAAVPRLLALNGMDPAGIKLDHSPAGDVDPGMVTEALSRVSGMLTMTAQDEVWLRSLLDMPDVTVEEIEAAKADAFERQRQLFEQRAAAFRNDNGRPVDEPDAMTAHYAASPPDVERVRQGYEDEIEQLMSRFFARQRRRVLARAKAMQGERSTP